MRQAPASIISASNLAKDESALKRKSEQDSDGMSSKNQRVDDFEEVPMDSDESGTCDLIVLGLSWKVCFTQRYEIKSPPWTILWFRILRIFSVENIKRFCVFMFQT